MFCSIGADDDRMAKQDGQAASHTQASALGAEEGLREELWRVCRSVVERHRGAVVSSFGEAVVAVFADKDTLRAGLDAASAPALRCLSPPAS